MVDGTESEDEDLHTQWAAQGYVQRWVLLLLLLLLTFTRHYKDLTLIYSIVKRALRAIESPEYKKASIKKKSLLPELTESMPPTEIFKLLPLSLLALRVSKIDPHEGHDHGPSKPAKRTKGLWTVKIEQQQDINPDLHYIWLYDGPQWRMKLYATGALVAIMAVVMFPLWPVKMRIGVWYLSMAMLGCIGLFFLMAIFRLILFVATVFTIPPGLWLYPNLFEDVGFFDSFRPIWGWQEVSENRCTYPTAILYANHIFQDKKAKKKAKAAGKKPSSKKEQATSTDTGSPNATETADAKTSFSTFKPAATINGNGTVKRNLTPRVEEVDEDDGT